MATNSGRELIPKVVDVVVDMVVAEYPNVGDVRLAIYEQIGENLIAMANCLRGKNEPLLKIEHPSNIEVVEEPPNPPEVFL